MATIPRRVLEYVSRQVDALSADARARVLRILESIEWVPGNEAECREAVVQALRAIMPTYTDAAAQAGADLYDAVREVAAGEAMGATAISGYDPDATEDAVHAFVDHIVKEGDVERFNREVLDRVDRDIRVAENVSVAENAALDPLEPRYARVPTGPETCEWCLMLASRGFAYRSERSAVGKYKARSKDRAASHGHPGCDCRIVQGYHGMEVEGYDPDALYSDYLDGKLGTFANKKRGGGSRTVSRAEAYERMGEFKDRMRAAEDLDELYAIGDEASAWFKSLRFNGDRRSREQARDGVLAGLRSAASRRHGELSIGGKPGIVTYTKPRSELTDLERAGIDWLAARGRDLETIPEIGDAPANLDVIMGGEEWEMKNVTNSESSVSNQIKRARIKWFKRGDGRPMRCIFTCEGCTDSFEDVQKGIMKRMREGESIIALSQNGEMVEL